MDQLHLGSGEPEPATRSGERRRDRRLVWLERGLFALGIGLIATWLSARVHGSWSQSRDRDTFEEMLEQARAEEPRAERCAAEATAEAGSCAARAAEPVDPDRSSSTTPELRMPDDAPDTSDWSAQRRRAWERALERDAGAPRARLDIPAIGLSVMAYDGNDTGTLNRGVGRIPGTAGWDEPGNLGLAGHRDGYFRALRNIQIGDLVKLTTLAATHEYRVESTQVVSPTQVEVLRDAGRDELTLVTCYPFFVLGNAPQRYIVKARLVEPGATAGAPEVAAR